MWRFILWMVAFCSVLTPPVRRWKGWQTKDHQINIHRRSRWFFIDGQSPLLLACTSRRASTICQLRKFYYLLPVNGFNSFPSSTVPQPGLLPTGVVCILLFSLHSCLWYLHSILDAKILCSYICSAVLDTFHISSDYFSL
ncbi:hypothetical protein EVA_06876 [gut metagenome]|uniref:Uncharacterized protein n=1 Tax=gut metagenome TaxID=749906 RepID=J9CXL0_9ZZZZ